MPASNAYAPPPPLLGKLPFSQTLQGEFAPESKKPDSWPYRVGSPQVRQPRCPGHKHGSSEPKKTKCEHKLQHRNKRIGANTISQQTRASNTHSTPTVAGPIAVGGTGDRLRLPLKTRTCLGQDCPAAGRTRGDFSQDMRSMSQQVFPCMHTTWGWHQCTIPPGVIAGAHCALTLPILFSLTSMPRRVCALRSSPYKDSLSQWLRGRSTPSRLLASAPYGASRG